MEILQRAIKASDQLPFSQMITIAGPKSCTTAKERPQQSADNEVETSQGSSLLQQRVRRWLEMSAARARKECSVSKTQTLSEACSSPLIMLQHDMQLSLNELRVKAGKPLDQQTMDTAPLLADATQQLAERTRELEKLHAAVLDVDKDIISSWNIDRVLQGSINEINDNYLSSYTNILAKFNDFFSDFADFKSKISQYISAGKNGKVKINSEAIYAELEKLINKYSDYALYPPEGKTASQEDAAKWAKEMGLPDDCIKSDGNGGFKVIMDISPLNAMSDSLIDTFHLNDAAEVDSAKYQAWLAGFDMEADKFQNFMQVMTQKYTTANSTFDNLIKVLSSTITSLLESDKSFFNI